MTKSSSGEGYGWVGFENMEAIWVQISVAIEATWEIEPELEAEAITLHPHGTYASFVWVCVSNHPCSIQIRGPEKKLKIHKKIYPFLVKK